MTSRSLKIALAVSVALNVFAATAVGAVWVARDKIEHRIAESHKSGRSEPVWDVIERMDPTVRDQVKAQLRAAAMQARPDFEEARAARREAIALTGAETFDPVAVAALLERSRASEARGRSRLEAGAVEVLSQLSPTDRKALAPILSRHKARRDARKPEKAAKPVAPAAPAPAAAPTRS
ncbi:periplasmic heavy metal sensor [Brevundimonas pondensis]|uniref:Periplasmic heavy metal sensor n=1 Tax=Brevundimonas pondensis TaxID=2774189 RepID=A0ABX7SKX2_9CAUL|nr:periplasmic heavy metal sensor [Brevundimonas pondensis]QTC88331.1 periplasmic heavy metal sensor [Brevundimonas pondensis]